MLRSLSLFVVLLGFWLLLSGRFHVLDPVHGPDDRFFTACGIGSCLFVTWLAARRMRILDAESHPIQLALRGLSYALWLLWQIVLANWDVFKRVWKPRLDIDPVVVRVPNTTRTDLGTMLYANSITLTPGTVTFDVDPERRELAVHCIARAGGEDLLGGAMLARVKRFEDGR
jgi:multicomponent Na+:H+ antiporter subunit E